MEGSKGGGFVNFWNIQHLLRALMAIVLSSKAANSGLIVIELMKSNCLPLILYATEAVSLSATNIRELDNSINGALYKFFRISDTSCLLQMRSYLGLPRIGLSDAIEARKCNFIDQLIDNVGYAVLLFVSTENLFY